MSDLDKLYQRQILEEAKNPFHFGKREDASITLRAFNPICGDRFDLYINDRALHFSGFGCTISKASTSFMIRELQGKSKAEALEIITDFLEGINEGKGMKIASLLVFEKIEHFEGRIDCIVLAWKAMRKHLLEYNDGLDLD